MVTGIPAARVPIVKFIHLKSGLSIDLSFKNKMAVMNTEFIRCCVNADSRVRIVMVSVRYWASVYGLSGGGHGGRTWKITNYALTLLIIFYLQVRNHYFALSQSFFRLSRRKMSANGRFSAILMSANEGFYLIALK